MGYYTDFELTYSGPMNEDALIEALNTTGYRWDHSLSLYGMKWYDCNEDMKKISELFPYTLFQLDGKGEESGDIWRTFFKNGKSHDAKVKIVYEDFDETKLK